MDTSKGKPASGIAVIFYSTVNDAWAQIASGTTNADGRVIDLLPKDALL